MNTRQFFEIIFDDAQGRAVITLPNALNKPTNDNWFQYPDELDQMVECVEANKYRDVWFSPILFKSDSRTKENALVTHVLAADADICEPSNFRTYPNLIVETSAGRYHAYWTLEEQADPQETSKVNRRIAQVHKDQGCDTAFVNAAKLMRVPGTSNDKHPGEVVVVADYDETRWFTFDELIELYPESEVPDMIQAQAIDMPVGLQDYVENVNLSDLLSGMPNNAEIRQYMYGGFHDAHRSEALFKLCCLLFEEGMDDQTVAGLMPG